MLSLAELVKDFPYSQQIQELYLKALYQNQSIKFESELRKTAAFACDRARLKAYILDDSFEKELKRKPLLTIVPADKEELIEHKNKKVHAGSPVNSESGDSKQFQELDPDKQEGSTEKNTPSKLDIKREGLPQDKEREEKNQEEEKGENPEEKQKVTPVVTQKSPNGEEAEKRTGPIQETKQGIAQQDYNLTKAPNTILDPELNDGFLSEAIHASISMEVTNRSPSPSTSAEQNAKHEAEHKAGKANSQNTDRKIDQNTDPETGIETGIETGKNTRKKQEHPHTIDAKTFHVPQKEGTKQVEDKKSFIQWIKHYDQETREKEIERVNFKQKASSLIDAFISNQPKIKPKKDFYSAVDMASKSIKDHQEAISETLAKIIFSQKNYKKAIEMYQALSLKFPEKKAYFANQIQAIKIAQKK